MASKFLALPQFKFAEMDPAFRFVKEGHHYFLGERELPSFSLVESLCGNVEEGYYRPEHAQRGSDVHQAVHFLNDGDLRWESVRGEIYGYVMAYERLVKDWNIQTEFFEVPLYHPDLGFGVTPDVVCRVLNNVPAIFELKTGQVIRPLAAKQTAAQGLGVRYWERVPLTRRRWAVTLNANGTYNKPIEFDDPMDEIVFKANLITAQDKIKNGLGGQRWKG